MMGPPGHQWPLPSRPPVNGLAGLLAMLVLFLLVGCQRTRTADALTCPFSAGDYTHQIAAASDWDTLYTLYKDNAARCPASAAEATYSRQLVLLLARQWRELPAVIQAAQRDPALEGFIYGHIDQHAGAAELKQLLENARRQCPTGASAFCEQLAWHAQAALIAQGIST